MIRIRSSLPGRAVAACLGFVFLILASCWEGGIGELAGGGTGGTGISTGPITGFGSVILDGEIFKTDDEVAPGFKTKKTVKGVDHPDARDRDLFRVGMLVTIRHEPAANNASEIDYEPVLRGPVLAMSPGAEPSVVVLGRTVILGDSALFASLGLGNVVEFSGFVDDRGRIRATYAEVTGSAPAPGDEFEIKGYVTDPDPSAGTFGLGSLPDGTGSTVAVRYSPESVQGLPEDLLPGTYVQVVTTDSQPVNGFLAASRVTLFVPRTSFPEDAIASLDGLVTNPGSASGTGITFDLEGKEVQTTESTEFIGGTAADIRPNVRVQAHGREAGGTLSAERIVFR